MRPLGGTLPVRSLRVGGEQPVDLVDAAEIARRLGYSRRQVVHTWRSRYPDFPEPLAELTIGLVWDWADIERWAVSTRRLRDR